MREQLGKNDIMPKLILVGEGPRSGYCRRLSEQLGLTDCIQFVGWQSNLDNYYRSGNVAVSMSQEDALPNFLVEAQWCGMPVIAADCAGVRECFAPGISGFLIASEDCKAMAGHVLRFMTTAHYCEKGRVTRLLLPACTLILKSSLAAHWKCCINGMLYDENAQPETFRAPPFRSPTGSIPILSLVTFHCQFAGFEWRSCA
ncbi:MAG: glycosyltransferase [Verrucomicrobia bacterium]|nr:glycosyltransferase [Verrucomicrobiota bacterium]